MSIGLQEKNKKILIARRAVKKFATINYNLQGYPFKIPQNDSGRPMVALTVVPILFGYIIIIYLCKNLEAQRAQRAAPEGRADSSNFTFR